MNDSQKIRLARSINWRAAKIELEDTLSTAEMAYEKMIVENNATLADLKASGEIDEVSYLCFPHNYEGKTPCTYCAESVKNLRLSRVAENMPLATPRPTGQPMPEGAEIEPPKMVKRPKDWSKVDASLEFTLTPHEIMLGHVFAAGNPDEMEARYQELRNRVVADGGWHGNVEALEKVAGEVAA